MTSKPSIPVRPQLSTLDSMGKTASRRQKLYHLNQRSSMA